MLEPYPGRQLMDEGNAQSPDTRYFIRVTHSSGMLEGKYTADTTFPPEDHRSHRPRSWLTNGLKKIETLQFLTSGRRTLGQTALQWLLADNRIASCLPNIYNEEQLVEFAKAPETPALTPEELARVETLARENFGVVEEPGKFKGTMTRQPAASAV
jgi:aryl-alcohol dehydrogenase-like predicted oxidoreductase